MPAEQQTDLQRVIAAGQWRVVATAEGGLLAVVTWRHPLGVVSLSATLEPRELAVIAQQIRARLSATPGAVAGAWNLRAISSLARKVARGRVLRRLVGAANNVLQNPQIARAVGLLSVVPVYGQALAAAYGGARAATSLVAKAQRGDRRAAQQLGAVAQRAAEGVPEAQRAIGLVREARAQLANQSRLAQAVASGQYVTTEGVQWMSTAGYGAVAGRTLSVPRSHDGALSYGGRTMLLRG